MNIRYFSSLLLIAVLVASIAPLNASPVVVHGWIPEYQGSQTCLYCHPNAAHEVMDTIHWTWDDVDVVTGERVGKNTIVNNFCIAIASNEPRCTSCHVGVGYADKTFDFNNPDNVDCLVCHDTTGTYKKVPTGAGIPDESVDLLYVAQNAGKSSRATCGACHFNGGGGNGVKHGTMDASLKEPSRFTDVHMSAEGAGFSCVECHSTEAHEISGTFYSQAQPDDSLCRNCHTDTPHYYAVNNHHTERIACQTCHIPDMARGEFPTKMWWDWADAGIKNAEGKPMTMSNDAGYVIYDTKKGSFVWERNAVPEYAWSNGTVSYVSIDDQIDPTQPVKINQLHGSIDDPNARIFPVKRFTGRQPFDAGNNTLAIPHLFPSNASDMDAYWKGYDWTNAIAAGMAYADKPFSGQVGYVETEMTWMQNHMVAPREQSLSCFDCHQEKGRIDFAALGYSPAEVKRLTGFFDVPVFDVLATRNAPDSAITITFEAESGAYYKMQCSDDLVTWGDADGELLTPEPGQNSITWTSGSIGSTQRFFRALHLRQTMPY